MESHRWCCRSNGSSCCSVCRALSLWSEDTPSHLQAGGAGKPSSPEYCSHCMAEDGRRSWLNHQYRLSTCTHDKQKPLLLSNENTVPAPHLNVMCSLLPCDVEFEALHEKNNVCTPTPRSLFVNFAGGGDGMGFNLKVNMLHLFENTNTVRRSGDWWSFFGFWSPATLHQISVFLAVTITFFPTKCQYSCLPSSQLHTIIMPTW